MQNLIKEENKKKIKDKYNQGYQYGYENGEVDGFQNGQIKKQLSILDSYFNHFLNGKDLSNIELIGQIPLNLIKDKYGMTLQGQPFIRELSVRNLVI